MALIFSINTYYLITGSYFIFLLTSVVYKLSEVTTNFYELLEILEIKIVKIYLHIHIALSFNRLIVVKIILHFDINFTFRINFKPEICNFT